MKNTTLMIIVSATLAVGLGIGVAAMTAINGRKNHTPTPYTAFANTDFTISGTDSTVKTDNTQKASGGTSDTPKSVQNTPEIPLIGEDKAKEIALERAGLTADEVVFDRIELDRDNGVPKYELEFRKGYTEYDVEIKADDGRILSFERDIFD